MTNGFHTAVTQTTFGKTAVCSETCPFPYSPSEPLQRSRHTDPLTDEEYYFIHSWLSGMYGMPGVIHFKQLPLFVFIPAPKELPYANVLA